MTATIEERHFEPGDTFDEAEAADVLRTEQIGQQAGRLVLSVKINSYNGAVESWERKYSAGQYELPQGTD